MGGCCSWRLNGALFGGRCLGEACLKRIAGVGRRQTGDRRGKYVADEWNTEDDKQTEQDYHDNGGNRTNNSAFAHVRFCSSFSTNGRHNKFILTGIGAFSPIENGLDTTAAIVNTLPIVNREGLPELASDSPLRSAEKGKG